MKGRCRVSDVNISRCSPEITKSTGQEVEHLTRGSLTPRHATPRHVLETGLGKNRAACHLLTTQGHSEDRRVVQRGEHMGPERGKFNSNPHPRDLKATSLVFGQQAHDCSNPGTSKPTVSLEGAPRLLLPGSQGRPRVSLPAMHSMKP